MNNAIHNLTSYFNSPSRLVLTSFVLGILIHPIIKKIAEVSFRVFSDILLLTIKYLGDFSKWLKDRTFIIHLRSFGCEECADQHRDHIVG